MRPIQLVAIDLDGTLLRSDKRLSHKVIGAVHEVRACGVRVVIASARPPRSTDEIYQVLGLDTLQINYNGALTYDPTTSEAVDHQPMSADLCRRMVKLARRIDPQVCVSAEILDRWYTDRVDPTLATETAKVLKPDFVGPIEHFLRKPVTKLMFLAPPERLAKVHEAIRARFTDRVAILVSDQFLIQIVRKGVDKGVALAAVAERYAIAPEGIMAIGDAPNDIGMLRFAGWGVAVENAWEPTRAVADAIVPSNDEDGVAVALHRYVLDL